MSSNSAGPSQASTDGYEKYEPLVNFDRRPTWYHPGHANVEDIQAMVNDVLALARDLPRLGGSLVGSVTGLRMVEPALLDQVNGLQEALEVLANTVIGGASTRAHGHGVSDSGTGGRDVAIDGGGGGSVVMNGRDEGARGSSTGGQGGSSAGDQGGGSGGGQDGEGDGLEGGR